MFEATVMTTKKKINKDMDIQQQTTYQFKKINKRQEIDFQI